MSHGVPEAEYLSVLHAARVLDASTKTVRRFIALADDPLPAIRLGVGLHARIRIPRRDLIAWMERRRAIVPAQTIVDEIVEKVLA